MFTCYMFEWEADIRYAQDFILLMGVESKVKNHHPELKNVRPLFPFFPVLLAEKQRTY